MGGREKRERKKLTKDIVTESLKRSVLVGIIFTSSKCSVQNSVWMLFRLPYSPIYCFKATPITKP